MEYAPACLLLLLVLFSDLGNVSIVTLLRRFLKNVPLKMEMELERTKARRTLNSSCGSAEGSDGALRALLVDARISGSIAVCSGLSITAQGQV